MTINHQRGPPAGNRGFMKGGSREVFPLFVQKKIWLNKTGYVLSKNIKRFINFVEGDNEFSVS